MNNEVLTETKSHHEDFQNLFDQEWQKSEANEIIKGLKGGQETLQNLMEACSGFSEAFAHKLDTIACGDGRVLYGRQIGLAGSGVLMSERQRDKFAATYRGQIKTVTSHEGCGAAKLKFDELVKDKIMPFEIRDADQFGKIQAELLAQELEAEDVYLPIEEMASEVHNERMLVLDATGCFDSTNLKDLPPHFVASGFGFGLDAEYMKKEISVYSGIALGDHGFGRTRFNEKSPFYLMVVANDAAQLQALELVTTEAAQEFGPLVKIVGCLKPVDTQAN